MINICVISRFNIISKYLQIQPAVRGENEPFLCKIQVAYYFGGMTS